MKRSLAHPDDRPTPARRREAFQDALANLEGVDRRTFLERMGAAIALSGLGACTRAPDKKILPYVEQPPEVTPGVALRYATAIEVDGYGLGLIAETHEGRPTKMEGNPAHPASLGASSAVAQASVLSLYDPARLVTVRHGDEASTWDALAAKIGAGKWIAARGRGLHLVMAPTSSPTIAAQLGELRTRFPEAQLHVHAPRPNRGWRDAANALFGRVLDRRLDVGAAEVVLALDDDLLGDGPAFLRHARRFADRRRDPLRGMNRLYVVEPQVTVTGMSADHRLAVRHADVAAIAGGILAELGGLEGRGLGALADRYRRAAAPYADWVKAAARDLASRRGASLVVAGDSQPAEVHAIALAIDAALGSLGGAITTAPSPLVASDMTHDVPALAAALDAGQVELLVVLDADLVYGTPADVDMARRIGRAETSVYVGSQRSPTARACQWTAPRAHAFEAWGDTRAFDGTASIVQPLIAPLGVGRSDVEVLAMLLGAERPDGHAIVRAQWKRAWAIDGEAFERRWEDALARGVVDGSASGPTPAALSWSALGRMLDKHAPAIAPKDAPLEIVFPRDPRMHEGRFADNAWLLEMPHPVTKLTWENAVEIAPSTAARHHVDTGDVVTVEVSGRTVEAPVVVVHGQAEGVIALATGWGAELAGGHGVNAHRLATARAWHVAEAASFRRTAPRRELPIAQAVREFPSHEREHAILRHQDLAEHRENPKKLGEKRELPKLYQNVPSHERQWAMAVDLGVCTGCSACVVACMAENNVPTVGADGVVKSRSMHWLRIDTYLTEGGTGTYAPQPMLCQHCEMAPCEYVCPVNATVHSGDGLNEMVYNRCVGTRFCSNNCPYKVRRFNWFDYHSGDPALVQMVRNPDVTVRARGVMEKCTFCVQRIREAEIAKRAARQPIADGDVVTACQQACPTGAIVFGNKEDPRAKVTELLASPRAYAALEELGTRPRVTYLGRIRNRNEELP